MVGVDVGRSTSLSWGQPLKIVPLITKPSRGCEVQSCVRQTLDDIQLVILDRPTTFIHNIDLPGVR